LALGLDEKLRLRELLLLLLRDVVDPTLDLELAHAMRLLFGLLLREQPRLLLGEL
jgi:hypothetical protein